MVSDQFESILKDFESIFQCPLKPDAKIPNTCLIQLNTGIEVQIELDPHANLLIAVR